MKKSYAAVCGAAICLGGLMHFVFDWLPNPLTALVAPVSESVWEHLKLLYWPLLFSAGVLSPWRRGLGLWSGFLVAELTAPVLLLGLYYLLLGGFAVEGLAIDLGLYVFTMIVAFYIAFEVDRRNCPRIAAWLVLPVIFYGAALVLFTFAPPPLPIFAIP